ncbi:MAG: response regulator [Limisphaerales bacterium]
MNQRFFLVAEDDPDDIYLLTRAFEKMGLKEFKFVRDGVELLDYLQARGQFGDRKLYPLPHLLIVDLEMPRMGGLDVLRWLQNNVEYCSIPTIVWAVSNEAKDMQTAYECGANTYFCKQNYFEDIAQLVSMMSHFWTEAQMPAALARHRNN